MTEPAELLRLAPASPEAEMAVLGALLAHPAALEAVRAILEDRHFADDRHGRIYAAICAMADAGQPANPFTLKAWAERELSLDELGGATYLAKLAASSLTLVAVRKHARYIIDMYRRRRLMAAAQFAMDQAGKADPTQPPAGLAKQLQHDLDAIFDGGADAAISAFTNWGDIAEKSLPPRRWIVARRLLRGEVSLLAAPGGTGKSMFDVLTALAVVTGRDLTGETIVDPCPAWIICNEDSTVEIQRRVLAAMRHFGIVAATIAGLLHITGADGPPVVLFDKVRDTPTATDACDAIARQARAWGVGLVIMDSLTTLHRSPEVDNIQLDAVMRGIIGIARQVDCAISLTTHTRKLGANAKDAPGDMDTIRGGGAIAYAARVASTMATMSDGAAGQFGIDPEARRQYLRLDDAKGNYAELDPAARWFRKLSVELSNGDGVGVLEPWGPPGALEGVTLRHVRLIQDAIEATPKLDCRADRQSASWVGFVIAPIIDRDASRDTDAAAIQQMIRTWIRNGVLVAAREKSLRQGRMVPIIRVGKIV